NVDLPLEHTGLIIVDMQAEGCERHGTGVNSGWSLGRTDWIWMIFPLAWRNRSRRERIFLMTGFTPVPCLSQPSAFISTIIRPVCSRGRSTFGSVSMKNLRIKLSYHINSFNEPR